MTLQKPPEPPTRHLYGFIDMQVGDFKQFTFETNREAWNCQMAAGNIARKRGWKFATEKTRLADGVIIVSVWRVEK